MSDVGAAIIGTGFMGAVHTESLRRAGVRVAGILGSSEEKSRAAAERWGIPRAYRTFEELLEDPSADAVQVAVPNRLHFPLAGEALERGKHVLCEKPLVMTSAESAALLAIASDHPAQAAGVCYHVRFYPLCIEARERVRRGDIGEVLHVGGSYVQDWLLLPTDYNWRVLAEEGGALRSMADIGSHWLDLTHFITGLEVQAVCADLRTVHPVRHRPEGEVETFKGKEQAEARTRPVEISTDDCGAALLRYASGARGCLWTSQVTAGRKNCLRFEIAGTEGSLSWNSERPNELWLGSRSEANRSLIKDPSLVGEAARAAISYPGGHNEGYGDTFKQLFRAFYAAIDGEAPVGAPFATFEDGHRDLLNGEAILRSHREERWVTVKTRPSATQPPRQTRHPGEPAPDDHRRTYRP
jgi:predicted dehydrogenase